MQTTFIRNKAAWYGLLFAFVLTIFVVAWSVFSVGSDIKKGYGITETGLHPIYPSGYACSPLTSLYASYIDVDGTRRTERHSGVDGGRLGEVVLAPADGTVKAVWRANWGWGREGALLIRHSREDVNLSSGPPFYYSAFYHLRYRDVRDFKTGERVERGEEIGVVDRPGGKSIYLPEVHWEVYEVADDDAIEWGVSKYKTRYWTNKTSELVDPLYLMSLNDGPGSDKGVKLVPYDADTDYSEFRGFTYILPCLRQEQ